MVWALWNLACGGQRSLKMWVSLSSKTYGPIIVATAWRR